MILNKTIQRTAQWNKETNAWLIEETMVYQWHTMKTIPSHRYIRV